MASVETIALRKMFGDMAAVSDVSFRCDDGMFLSLLGPSGCGKTTSLRMIAGLEAPSAGTIKVGSNDITAVPAYGRNMGYVFQSYALFPHKTVAENIAFGLKMRKASPAVIAERTREAIDLTRLQGLDQRYPRQLSGGQQQRVAIARALAIQPAVLLLDEPLSNLDRQLRMEVRLELRKLQQRLGITTILVTHDQDEALSMSDQVVVMQKGRIMQAGTPSEIYNRPQNRFVATFLGDTNLFDATVIDAGRDRIKVGSAIGTFDLPSTAGSAPVAGTKGFLSIRPEMIDIRSRKSATEQPADVVAVKGRVETRVFVGSSVMYEIRLPGGELIKVATGQGMLGDDGDVGLTWSSTDWVFVVE